MKESSKQTDSKVTYLFLNHIICNFHTTTSLSPKDTLTVIHTSIYTKLLDSISKKKKSEPYWFAFQFCHKSPFLKKKDEFKYAMLYHLLPPKLLL